MPKMISATKLALLHNITKRELDKILEDKGFIEREDNTWALTDSAKEVGAVYKDDKKFGKYITWPDDLELGDVPPPKAEKVRYLSATALGNHFNVTAKKMNSILSELGWISKSLKGWNVTPQGLKHGGMQDEDKKTGIPYARWSDNVKDSKILLFTIEDLKGEISISSPNKESACKAEKDDFRSKFKAEHRTTDGHFVRSKAEMLIDNWLYMAEVVHAYERKLPIEEDVYSDFYIPTGKVYIEYWGYENEPKYLHRKKIKQDLYEKYGFKLIELNDKDVQNLDDILPRLLLKHGIQTY